MKKYIIIFLVAVLCVTCIIPTMADNKNNVNDKMTEIDNKLNQIEQEKKEIYNQRNQLEEEKQAVISNHEEENEEYEKLTKELDLLNARSKNEDSLKQAEENTAKQSEEFQRGLL